MNCSAVLISCQAVFCAAILPAGAIIRSMKLRELYPTLTMPEREQLAAAAGTSERYIYQIATRWRGRRASLCMIEKLVAADPRLTLGELVAEFTEKPNA